MAILELSPQFPEEAALWLMEYGSGLEVKPQKEAQWPHREKAGAWRVIQVEGLYICSLSYNKKGNLYFSGAKHIVNAIERCRDQYLAAGCRGFFYAGAATHETDCTD